MSKTLLNEDLEEEVFVNQPPRFEEKGGRQRVCMMRKALYGLKQSPGAWFKHFGKVVKGHGYTKRSFLIS